MTSESHQEHDTQCIWKLHASRWPLGNSIFSRFMYFTDIMAIVSAVFSSYFLLFVTFGPTSSASQYARCCIYGKRSLPHFGYGHTRTQYTRYSDARDVTSSRRLQLAALYPVDIPRGVCVLWTPLVMNVAWWNPSEREIPGEFGMVESLFWGTSMHFTSHCQLNCSMWAENPIR